MIPIEAKSQDPCRWTQIHPVPMVVLGLLGVASVLSVRRVVGAIRSPLPAILLLATAALWVAVSWTVRLGLGKGDGLRGKRIFPENRPRYVGPHPAPGPRTPLAERGMNSADFPGGRLEKFLGFAVVPSSRWLGSWGMLAATLMAMFALSWPMGRMVDWLVWIPILASEIWRIHKGPDGAVFPPVPEANSPPTGNRIEAAATDPRAPAAGSDQVLQNITRVRDSAGDESFHGTLAAEFMPDVRTQVLHVAFCPPMMVIPDVHAEPSSGPDASVRVTQVLTHGARIEVRLNQPTTERVWVTVDFAAARRPSNAG